jgi:pilus assembly protein CpaE
MLGRNHMTQILIAGKSQRAVTCLEDAIKEFGNYKTNLNIMNEGCYDPFANVTSAPSMLVLLLEPGSTEELEALSRRAPAERVPFVVIGDQLEPHIMRSAMQAGARDFLSTSSDKHALGAALELLNSEVTEREPHIESRQTSIVNAAGGNGATTIAVNLAYQLSTVSTLDTVLVDLDFDYAPISQYLDVSLKRNLIEAVARVDELDIAAMDGYLTAHSSGVQLLGAHPSDSLVAEPLGGNFGRLLDLLGTGHERIIVDLPNHLNATSMAALDRSDDILVVMQQNLVSIRNAKHLIERLQHDLGVRENDITLVVNRYQKNANLSLLDIKKAVADGPMVTIPNQFKAVAESIEVGVPLMHAAAKSQVARSIGELEKLLGGKPTENGSFLTKTFSGLLRS